MLGGRVRSKGNFKKKNHTLNKCHKVIFVETESLVLVSCFVHPVLWKQKMFSPGNVLHTFSFFAKRELFSVVQCW